MLQKLEIQGVHMTVDESLRKYASKKLGRIDKYISRHNRLSAHAEVQLKEQKGNHGDHCCCEVTLHMPHETIVIKESTVNIYAAIDIVEAKLKQQLRKYKDLHQGGTLHRRLYARVSRSSVA